VKEQQHSKIVNLEREIREAEIILQTKRTRLQKMAEILSSNVNKAIVDTLSKQRLGEILARGPIPSPLV
jgi:hypothetical protein